MAKYKGRILTIPSHITTSNNKLNNYSILNQGKILKLVFLDLKAKYFKLRSQKKDRQNMT